MKRNRFKTGGISKTTKGNTRGLQYSGMTEKEAFAEWKKTATGNTRGVAGLKAFDNSLPEGHPFKDKKRTIGRYKNHPIGKLLS